MVGCIIIFSFFTIKSINSITPDSLVNEGAYGYHLMLSWIRQDLRSKKIDFETARKKLDALNEAFKVSPAVKERVTRDALLQFTIETIVTLSVGGLLLYTLRDKKK